MRPVAIVLACLLALTLAPHPAGATDECARAAPLCTRQDTGPTPLDANAHTYYLYAAAAQCPMGPSSCNGSPPARTMGLLWEETNCVKGLQRVQDFTACNTRVDALVLY